MTQFHIKCTAYELNGLIVLQTQEEVSLTPYGIATTIPQGFISDGMSVPRFFWRWISPPVDGRTMSPSVAHDWLYVCKVVTRAQADSWYRRQLVANGYPAVKSWAIWTALRLFGGSHWT